MNINRLNFTIQVVDEQNNESATISTTAVTQQYEAIFGHGEKEIALKLADLLSLVVKEVHRYIQRGDTQVDYHIGQIVEDNK